jgi:hypothetical protein
MLSPLWPEGTSSDPPLRLFDMASIIVNLVLGLRNNDLCMPSWRSATEPHIPSHMLFIKKN